MGEVFGASTEEDHTFSWPILPQTTARLVFFPKASPPFSLERGEYEGEGGRKGDSKSESNLLEFSQIPVPLNSVPT